MQLREAVNAILPALGEHPVDSVEAHNPTVGVVLRAIDNTLRTLLVKGWWFNSYYTDIYPDEHGVFRVPNGLLEWVHDGPESVPQGSVFVNPQNNLTTQFPNTTRLRGRVIKYVEFDDLPQSFADWVVIRSKILAYQDDIGGGGVLDEWERQSYMLETKVSMADLRSKRTGTKYNRTYQRIRKALRR